MLKALPVKHFRENNDLKIFEIKAKTPYFSEKYAIIDVFIKIFNSNKSL